MSYMAKGIDYIIGAKQDYQVLRFGDAPYVRGRSIMGRRDRERIARIAAGVEKSISQLERERKELPKTDAKSKIWALREAVKA